MFIGSFYVEKNISLFFRTIGIPVLYILLNILHFIIPNADQRLSKIGVTKTEYIKQTLTLEKSMVNKDEGGFVKDSSLFNIAILLQTFILDIFVILKLYVNLSFINSIIKVKYMLEILTGSLLLSCAFVLILNYMYGKGTVKISKKEKVRSIYIYCLTIVLVFLLTLFVLYILSNGI